jgi:hypothetical protein
MNPPTGTDLVPYVEPFRMTEREARTAGMTSNRLSGLRGSLRQGIKGGQLNVRTTNGNLALALTMVDTEALVALLIERDEALLIGLNIEIEK